VLAYRVQEYQVVGGPACISKDQFDIDAKPDPLPIPLMSNPARCCEASWGSGFI
jgi:uncharacterized protein (TIGR03435 family)